MTDPHPVLAAASRRSAALVSKDVGALLDLLHPDFVYVNASGDVLTRDQYLENYVRSDQVRWGSQEIVAPVLADGGTTVVLTCLVRDVAWFDGEELDSTFRSTLTWVATERGWRCLAGHTSAQAQA
ncbi:MAG TPA: nuclear transport factor 2 family protein [Micromonosporaceae bacterium]